MLDWPKAQLPHCRALASRMVLFKARARCSHATRGSCQCAVSVHGVSVVCASAASAAVEPAVAADPGHWTMSLLSRPGTPRANCTSGGLPLAVCHPGSGRDRENFRDSGPDLAGNRGIGNTEIPIWPESGVSAPMPGHRGFRGLHDDSSNVRVSHRQWLLKWDPDMHAALFNSDSET